jgi:hypothetical protein
MTNSSEFADVGKRPELGGLETMVLLVFDD